VRTFLRRYDPGSPLRWAYGDEFDERNRFAIDPKWRGELPRTYFFDKEHRAVMQSGLLDESWTAGWFKTAGATGR
jgi:hypothetical protein